MSNEELAIAIQNGKRGYIETLWQQVKRFVGMLAFRFYARFETRCVRAGVTDEDLVQVGFVALIDAVRAFDPSTGYKFLTYLKMQCRRHFRVALGLHTERAANDPLRNCQSLNEPLSEEIEDSERIDFIPDPSAQAPFEEGIDDMWRHELREAEEKALQLIDPQRADVMRRRYFEQQTHKEIGDAYGISHERIRQIITNARRDLRHGKCLALLRPFRNELYLSLGLHGTGLTAFRNNGSSTERAVETLEQRRERNDLRAQAQREMAELWELVDAMNARHEEFKRLMGLQG